MHPVSAEKYNKHKIECHMNMKLHTELLKFSKIKPLTSSIDSECPNSLEMSMGVFPSLFPEDKNTYNSVFRVGF